MLISKFIVLAFNFHKNDPTTIDVFCAPICNICLDLQQPSRFVINMPRSVIILPRFVLAKITRICNKNESHSANSFERWFIEICTFKDLLVKICSLSYTFVDGIFL